MSKPDGQHVIDVDSDAESVINVSDAELDHLDVEILSVAAPSDDIVITGATHTRPSGPRLRSARFTRNTRRRVSPSQRFAPVWVLNQAHTVPTHDMLMHLAAFNQQLFEHMPDLDQVPEAILRRLEREDEEALDRRMHSAALFNKKQMLKKKAQAGQTPAHTSTLDPAELLMCEVCGVVLGSGIPRDFRPDARYDADLAAHAAAAQVPAPWFCVRQCFESDLDLSLRVFAARCGHVFCGRCVKNIGARPPKCRLKKMTILNPAVYAPRKCPAQDCGTVFNKSKSTFTEVFL